MEYLKASIYMIILLFLAFVLFLIFPGCAGTRPAANQTIGVTDRGSYTGPRERPTTVQGLKVFYAEDIPDYVKKMQEKRSVHLSELYQTLLKGE